MTRIHHTARGALPAIILMLTLLSCNRETAMAPGDSKPRPDASEVGPVAARAIARAMAETEIRQQILEDMRDSPFSEHKVGLQDYLETPGGQRVLEAMQRAGIDADELFNTVRATPAIQFYVPSTTHRSTWRGTGDVLVATNLASDVIVAFSPAGVETRFTAKDVTMPDDVGALFVLQWREPMFRRWAGPTAATETIQRPEESQVGSGRVVRDASGHAISTTDDTPDGASRGPAPVNLEEPAGTYLTELRNVRGVGDGLAGEHLEFAFLAEASDNPTTYVSQLTGISTDAGSVWQGWLQVHTSRLNSYFFPVQMDVYVWETDESSDDDPFYCTAPNPGCPFDWPHLETIPSPPRVWPFTLCENTPDGCRDFQGTVHPDISLTFTDRDTPVATQVSVIPQNATISKGASQAYTAQVFDQYGGLMPSKVVTWTSSNTSVATVVSTGNQSATASGVGGGTVAITATADGASRGGTLIVLAPATVTVVPSAASICSNGGQVSLTAIVKDQQGTVWTAGTVAWSSSNTGSATITPTSSRAATVSGAANGSATITATLDGVSGTSSITVGTCLPTPTNCTIQYIAGPKYLKVAWTNADPQASTEVEVNRNGIWSSPATVGPGITQYFYVLGSQTGLFYARVRHVRSGYLPGGYCNTGTTTAP